MAIFWKMIAISNHKKKWIYGKQILNNNDVQLSCYWLLTILDRCYLRLIGSEKLQGHNKHPIYGIPYLQNNGIPYLQNISVASHYRVKTVLNDRYSHYFSVFAATPTL